MGDQHLYKGPAILLCLWSLQIAITLKGGELLICCNLRLQMLAYLGIHLTTLDLESWPGHFDPSAIWQYPQLKFKCI